MTIKEIEAKTILRKHKKIDSWFISRYGMNLYRGCVHNCVYCDGRAEKYNVEGEFGEQVAVKVNAIEILRRELDPRRKRVPFKPCFMMVGGGVGDSYQSVEANYQLTRKALELMLEFNHPVHVLTKSTLIERDLDLLTKINEQTRTIVSFSFSSVDEKISSIVEPGVPSPQKRLETLSLMKRAGIVCGMFLLPVIPFITDTKEQIEASVKAAKEAGVDFVIFGGMTLKDGRQKDYFFQALDANYPELSLEYLNIYKGDQWGQATPAYYHSINYLFNNIAKQYRMPTRIPLRLFKDILSENDLVVVLLEQIDYCLKMAGRSSPYGYAAYSISKLKQPLSTMQGMLEQIKGVGKTMASIIMEILQTGTSKYYEKLMRDNIDQ